MAVRHLENLNEILKFVSEQILQNFFFFTEGRYTLDIFAPNIAIKRYCDKKTFFIENIVFLCVLKIFFWDNFKYFEMSLQYFEEKKIFLSKCLFIFLSQYCVQKCLVCISPFDDFFNSKQVRSLLLILFFRKNKVW
jgi:hypothetical protein